MEGSKDVRSRQRRNDLLRPISRSHCFVTPPALGVGFFRLGRIRLGSGSPVSRSNSSGLSFSGRTSPVSRTHSDNARLMLA